MRVQGATVAVGASRQAGPALLPARAGRVPRMRGSSREVFGPSHRHRFDTEEEDRRGQRHEYGLAATSTRRPRPSLRVAERSSGMVGVNRGVISDPGTFGGVKQSGLGREGAWRASRSTGHQVHRLTNYPTVIAARCR